MPDRGGAHAAGIQPRRRAPDRTLQQHAWRWAQDNRLLGSELANGEAKLRELRFHLSREAVRITYWIASGRRIILPTVFKKQRMREVGEIERAVRAMERCVAEAHTADEE
ncbi:type II toxin-antitoxin system RelE/ParE family toxin [Nonomuraea lactucae]|uniref:type II toxin-antitoxin system RelE/ParE family toxin n=1 Tax=Nonomuraea lactucae TaxID=2249762 RepID=UPI00196380E0|nr:type II toxin-antitoxin system RelE/ParE family toxin [Nonomuraea lactucae]